eukprot:symbB.v1.2.014768.t1/scaffold1084.1/size139254/7
MGEVIRLVRPIETEEDEEVKDRDDAILSPVQKVFDNSAFDHIHSVAKPRVSVRGKGIDLQLVSDAAETTSPGQGGISRSSVSRRSNPSDGRPSVDSDATHFPAKLNVQSAQAAQMDLRRSDPGSVDKALEVLLAWKEKAMVCNNSVQTLIVQKVQICSLCRFGRKSLVGTECLPLT